MRTAFLGIMFGLAAAVAAPVAHGCNPETGERQQFVHLEWNGHVLDHLTVDAPEIHRIALPDGPTIGLRIAPAPPETYAAAWERRGHVPELVAITLYDLSGSAPKELATTYGGSNSVQGYGAGGGAAPVAMLGDPGLEMVLLKPVCAPRHAGAEIAATGR